MKPQEHQATCQYHQNAAHGSPSPLGRERAGARGETSLRIRLPRCRQCFAAFFVSLGLATGYAQTPVDALEQGFKNPPDSAKPRVWWHWTGGNVTKEGITKDLEWMKRVGIGGAHMADIGGAGGGQTIENPLTFFTPEWFDTVKHAAVEC